MCNFITITIMKPEVHILSNGLRVVFIDTKAFSSITTLLLVGAGSRYENMGNNGIAHFFEHMAFKGSKKYPSSFLISSLVEGLGGVFNAFTGKDHTGYYIKATNEHFNTVIDVLSDMVLNSLLIEEEIQREKGVILEELNMYEDTPSRKIADIYEGLLYKGNPLGYDIIGTKGNIKDFTRKVFINYIRELYNPENAVLVVAGGLGDKKKYLDIVKEKFLKWEKGKEINIKEAKESQNNPQTLVKYKKTEQAHLCLGFRAFSYFDKRKYALNVLSAILGAGMSSRLFIEVRERRGLCYYISEDPSLYSDVGNITIQAGITNNPNKVKEAVEVMLKEHKKVMQGDVKKDELKKVKELLKGRLLLSMEDSFNVAYFAGRRLLLEGTVRTPGEIIKRIEKVTRQDIIDVSSQVFDLKRLNFAIIGPFKKLKLNFRL